MSFADIGDFIAMGGHGGYVWSCYGITLVVLIYNLIRPRQLRKKFIAEQARLLRKEERYASDS